MTSRIAPAAPGTIRRAVDLLRNGQLVAFPTETVYGLGADARNRDAVHRIFAAKGRPADHPVIVHLADAAQLDRWAAAVPRVAQRLADAFWPGPLTLILPRHASVNDAITGGQDTIGVRVPAHAVAQEILRAFGEGVAAPSANRFGRISPTTAQHVADDLGERVALIVDGGACAVGIESTIVACLDDRAMLLRPGGIAVDALQAAAGATIHRADVHAPRASGTLPSHYAPRTPARLVNAAELLAIADAVESAVLARTVRRPGSFAGTWIDAPDDPRAYAHDLYASLRMLDAASASAILIEDVPHDASWTAVRDRLSRATHGAEDSVADMD